MKDLNLELVELFDMRKAKIRNEKNLTAQADEAKKDIRMLTIMFSDGIPSLKVKMDEEQYIIWDAPLKSLFFFNGKKQVLLEGSEKEICVKARPFLREMVAQAKKFYL